MHFIWWEQRGLPLYPKWTANIYHWDSLSSSIWNVSLFTFASLRYSSFLKLTKTCMWDYPLLRNKSHYYISSLSYLSQKSVGNQPCFSHQERVAPKGSRKPSKWACGNCEGPSGAFHATWESRHTSDPWRWPSLMPPLGPLLPDLILAPSLLQTLRIHLNF